MSESVGLHVYKSYYIASLRVGDATRSYKSFYLSTYTRALHVVLQYVDASHPPGVHTTHTTSTSTGGLGGTYMYCGTVSRSERGYIVAGDVRYQVLNGMDHE